MRRLLIVVLTVFLAQFHGFSQEALPRTWSRLWGSSIEDLAGGVAVHTDGNAYVAGGTSGIFDHQDPPGNESVVLSKFSPSGERLWSQVWGPANNASGHAVAVDSAGGAIVAGQTWGAMQGQTAVGNGDLFLTRIRADGSHSWTRIWGSSRIDAAYGLTIAAKTDLLVAGYAAEGFDDQKVVGSKDLCVSRLDSKGSRLWTRLRGTAAEDIGYDVVTDAQGNVYVCGMTSASLDDETFNGSRDICLIKYSAEGVWEWTRLWGGKGIDEARGVAVDGQGAVYVTGFGGSFNGQQAVGGSDPFLIKVDPQGVVEWTRIWGSIWTDAGFDVTVAEDGLLYVVGMASSAASFDGETERGALFMTCFKSEGTKQWTRVWGSTDGEARGVAALGNDRFWVAGHTQGGFDDQTGLGEEDLFLSFWGPEIPQPLSQFTISGVGLFPHFHLEAETGVDRVEFTINGEFLGTVYGPPFSFAPDYAQLAATAGFTLDHNRVEATAFDNEDRPMAAATATWGSWFDGIPTEVRIDHPWRDYTVYTDDAVSPPHPLVIRAYAGINRLIMGTDHLGRPRSRSVWVPLTEGGFEVRLSVDGELLHISTNGLAHDPFYHEFAYDTVGLPAGSHRVYAHLIPPEGYAHAFDSASFNIERRHPELRVSREVFPDGNHFNVTLTVRNHGSGPARLFWLEENMTGFQGCNPSTSLPMELAEWSYSHAEKQCRARFEFGSHWLPAGEARTLDYTAVPVLYRGDCDYSFGGDGGIGYSDAAGNGSLEHLNVVTLNTSPWSSRISIAAAVTEACANSDYLLVTDPVNLAQAYDSAGADSIVELMAGLASLRNGVLGYHHSLGMVYTDFRPGDLVGRGDLILNRNPKDQIFIGQMGSDRIRCYAQTGEQTMGDDQLPIHLDLRSGDALAIGNVESYYLQLTEDHTRPEVVVAWGDEHGSDAGRIFVHQVDYDTNRLNHFEVHEFESTYNTGDAMAVGEVWSNPNHSQAEDVIVARSDGEIVVYYRNGNVMLNFTSRFEEGDFFEVGDLVHNGMGHGTVEMVVGDVAANRLRIYQGHQSFAFDLPTYSERFEISATLEPEDAIAIGDVMGDALEEIVVADASEGRFRIYGFNLTDRAFEEVGNFRLDYHAGDEMVVGRFNTNQKGQVLVLRGHGLYGRREGTVEIIGYFEGENPGDRWALDDLIDVDGRWANALAPGWTAEGYLLLVGETEIIPTFTKSWNIDDWDGKVDYTDRNYASTDSESDNNRPELSVGRIPGNSAERIQQALRTAIEVANNPGLLNNSQGYCVSGTDEEVDRKFAPLRRSIADRLSDRGFSVTQQHAPGTNGFATAAVDQDVIFFTAHGNPHVTGGIQGADIRDHFNPGSARPIVYAASCLTGRYPASGNTLGERFLSKGAAAYLGATEITYHWYSPGLDVRGWDPRMAEAFFGRLEAGRPIGRSLTLAKRHRLSGDANTYGSDWNKNRYHCAIYHMLGDPKLEIAYAGGGDPRLMPMGHLEPFGADPLEGPVSELSVTVPMYEVTEFTGAHAVDIPGQDHILVLGCPEVPFHATTIRFPRRQVVQGVTLQERSGIFSDKGLILPPIVPYTNAAPAAPLAPTEFSGWWPDRDFDWSVAEESDGSTLLTIKAYPFVYHTETTESQFYTNHLFGISYVESPLEIARFKTDRPIYPTGAIIHADLSIVQPLAQPIDVVVESRILENEFDLVEALPSRTLSQLGAQGWTQLDWESAKRPGGEFIFEVKIKGPNDVLLDEARTEFQVGQADGRINRFEIYPQGYQLGDDVQLSAELANTGNTHLEGTLVIAIQDAAGNPFTEFRKEFSGLTAGESLTFDTVWKQAGLHPRNCQFLVYAEFDGHTTALSTYADWSSEPLLWDVVAVTSDAVELEWHSVAGRRYRIEFTPDIGDKPFSPVLTDLPATPPRNIQLAPVQGPQGFYRLREEP